MLRLPCQDCSKQHTSSDLLSEAREQPIGSALCGWLHRAWANATASNWARGQPCLQNCRYSAQPRHCIADYMLHSFFTYTTSRRLGASFLVVPSVCQTFSKQAMQSWHEHQRIATRSCMWIMYMP